MLFAACPAFAGDESLSHYAASYLLKPAGVRAMGMGDAYVAVSNDHEAPYYNPAGLGFLKFSGIGSMYSPQSEDQKLWSMNYVQSLGSWGGVGAGLVMNEISDIEGRLGEFDAPNRIDSHEGAATLSYGYAPAENWAVGGNLKYLFHSFSGLSDNGRGYGVDFGVRANVVSVPGLVVGASAQNVLGSFHWSTGRTDPLLSLFKSGAAYRVAPWLTAVGDVDIRGDQALRFHVGAEMLNSFAACRLGVNHNHPTFGVGLTTPKAAIRVRFDYAFELDTSGLDNINRMGLSVRF